ncbi:lipoxygenasey domain-containing protein 1 [Biomphalaria glabrata]|nr:lipoxygenase homology domain-containing protein 1-like [Biomphalaria glabrata]KAI8774235.1 lipoxygenasey domain-containing protein 1 [Biomphalaria glabrata]
MPSKKRSKSFSPVRERDYKHDALPAPGHHNNYKSPERRSRFKQQSAPSPDPYRKVIQEPQRAKTCYFYRDGDTKFKAVKVCVHPKKFSRLETLVSELSLKVTLPFGVRSIYTPHGSDRITSLDMLEDNGNYICSPLRQQAKGLDPNSVVPPLTWHYQKPSSGTKELNRLLQEKFFENKTRRLTRSYLPRDHVMANAYNRTQPKKLTVLKNGEPSIRHVVLINRRTAQTFEQILADLSGMFGMAVRKLYTLEGKSINNLLSLVNGPDILVAANQEPFRTMVGFIPESLDRESRNRSRISTYSRFDVRSRIDTSSQMDLSSRVDVSTDRGTSRMKKRKDRLAKTRGHWKIWCKTNELSSSGTSAQISITVYGSKDNSGAIPLGFPDGSNFQPGQVDEFDVNLGKDVGEVYKIRLSHDNSGSDPDWFCDEIRMQDMDTEELLVFPCHKWLARNKGDNEISRELPADRKGEPQLPVIKYEVTVVTGDLWNGGTRSNVYLTIYGDRGDSGVRQLFAQSKEEIFNKGQTNHFTVEAVSLGIIKRAIVGHDGTSPGDGWYLEKLIIREPDAKSHEVYSFYCGRWLDSGEDDGKIVRELKVQDDYLEDILEKRNWEYEKWKFESKTQIKLMSMLTGKALRIKPDGTVDGLGEDSFPGSTLIVSSKKPMVRIFASFQNSNYHLAVDNGKITGMGRGGPQCEFRVHVQSDRTVMLEAAKSPLQFISLLENGKLGESRSILDKDPAKRFHVYVKGIMRHKGIIMLRTSNTQAISVDHDKSVYATGRCNRAAHFRVHKVDQGGVRMFESMIYPGFYLRYKDGVFDSNGSRSEDSHFLVTKHKNKGYFTLQLNKRRGTFVGFTPRGDVRPMVENGSDDVHIFPEVIEFGISKSQLSDDNMTPISERASYDGADTRRQAKIEDGDFNVHITTAESLENGHVQLTVFGEKGSTAPILLTGSSDKGPLFKSGSIDQFKINLSKIGKLRKSRLELVPHGLNIDPVWKVQRMILTDLNTQEKYVFNFDCWLSRESSNQDIIKELPAVKEGQLTNGLPVVKYFVTVFTGREPGSESNAKIHLNIFGDLGDSGKRLLRISDKVKPFQRGQSDTFEIEAVHLGALNKIQIGHNETKPGDGWFCEKVVIREGKTANMEFVFPCNRWFDSNMEDRKLERTLLVQEPAPSKRQDSKEDVQIYLSTHPNSGNVLDTAMLYAYSKDGSVSSLTLGAGRDGFFKPGATDEFKRTIFQKLNSIYKVRLGLTEEIPGSDWHVEKIKIKSPNSGEELDFDVSRWISRKKEDCDVWRELPAARFEEPPLPVITYIVEVHTSDITGADTEASIFITLLGERGDTGKRRLFVTQTEGKMFSQGKIDSFTIEAVTLGTLKSIIIGHTEKRPGAGWHLSYVAVKEPDFNDEQLETFFPCEKWLDTGQDDGLTERQLFPGQRPKAIIKSNGEFTLWVKTAQDSQPSNGGKAVLVIYGDRGRSPDIDLHAPSSTAKLFEPGKDDEFQVSAGDIGQVYKIRITREDKPDWKAWHLNEVKLLNKTTKEVNVFIFDCWLANDTEDGDFTAERPVLIDGQEKFALKKYEIKVTTGDHWAADTDANVYVLLYGSNGDSGKRFLKRSKTKKRKFQRGTDDIFTIKAVDLKIIDSVVVGHDGKGQGSGWFLKHLIVTDLSSPKKEKYVLPCGRWLDDGEDDGKTERLLRTMGLLNITEPQSVPLECGGKWRIKIRTSDFHGADCNALVILKVYGTKDNSEPLPLHGGLNLFSQGKESEFDVTLGKIGEITKIRLQPENDKSDPSWHVDWILMKHTETGYHCLFIIDRWLALDKEDCQIFRECAIESPGWMPAPLLRYIILIQTGRHPNSGAHGGLCSINLIGSQGDTGQQILSRSLNTSTDQMKDSILDVYVMEAVCVGQLRNVRLGFDGRGLAKKWFIESVRVMESLSALTSSVFTANCWLDAEKNTSVVLTCTDTSMAAFLPSGIDNTLLGHSIPESKGLWDLWIWTGNQDGAGTMNVISLVLYGTTGPSTPIILNKNKELYAGSLVHMKIETMNIGDLFKIRLAFATKQNQSSWFLERIKLKDSDTKQEFNFEHNNWVQVSEENQNGTVELAAVRPDLNPLLPVSYKISVTTGDLPCAETDAEISLMLIGQWGDSGQQLLTKSLSNKVLFRRGQTDVFVRNLLDVGKINKIFVGHGEHGRGHGWHCQQISVLATGQNGEMTETIFACSRWLDTGVDDRQTSREFVALGNVELKDVIGPSARFASHGVWTCHVKIASIEKLDVSKSSFQAVSQIFITVCGTNGVTGPLELGEGKMQFSFGQIFTLKGLKFRDIGEIVKLRVTYGRENSRSSAWVIEEIVLEDETNREKLRFDFSECVGELNGDLIKERPVVRPGSKVPPVVQYVVKIMTEDIPGAGTSANVHINLIGSKGDSGRHLLSSPTNPFRSGQLQEFIVEAVDLGEVNKLALTKGPGDPWILNHIVVKSGMFGPVENIFLCKNTIGTSSKRDQEVDITLPVTFSRPTDVAVPTSSFPDFPVTRGQWTIETTTGPSGITENGQDIVVVFCGNKKESSPVDLKAKRQSSFQPGMKDKIKLTLAEDVGEIIKIRLGFKDMSSHKSWHLQQIKFEDKDTRDTFWFAFNDFVKVDDVSDGWREFPAIWPGVYILPIIKYTITVTTGDEAEAGCNELILVKLNGQMGSTGYRILKDTEQKHFQQGQTNIFVIEAVSLLNVSSVTIGHTNTTPGAGWFLTRLIVKPDNDKKEYLFTCNRWFDAGCDDGETMRTLNLNEDGSTTVVNTHKSVRPRITSLQTVEGVMKPTTVVPLGDKGKPPSPKIHSPVSKKAHSYSITIVTGDGESHGTAASLVLILYGDKGFTEPMIVGKGVRFFALKSGATQNFEISSEREVGDLYKVRIGFDSQGKEKQWYSDFSSCPSWFGKMIKIKDNKTHEEYQIHIERWIKMETDHDYWREFPIKPKYSSHLLSVKNYFVDAYTGEQPGAGTYANVYVQIFGQHGDTGWRHLHGSKTNMNKFQVGYHDVFHIEAVDLGKLSQIKVKHDGLSPGDGWFLKCFKVKDTENSKQIYFFSCERWLDVGKEDHAIERILPLTAILTDEDEGSKDETINNEEENKDIEENENMKEIDLPEHTPETTVQKKDKSKGDWRVYTRTSDEPGSGTDANITLTIFGTKGDSGPLALGKKGEGSFHPGHTDETKVWIDPNKIGEIRKIRLQHDDIATDWKVDNLVMENPSTGEKHSFEVNRWLSHKEIDGDIVFEGAVKQHNQPVASTCKYIVKTITESEENAGTEANVYINLIGNLGDSGKRFLVNSSNGGEKFSAGKTNYFTIEAVDLGDLEKIVIGHDGTTPEDAWKLLCVMVRKADSANRDTSVFPCGKWLTSEDGEITIFKGKIQEDDDDDYDEDEDYYEDEDYNGHADEQIDNQ